MNVVTPTETRKNIYGFISQVNENHETLHIVGKKNSAFLVGEEDWKSIQETLFLLSVPNMRESLLEGKSENISNCETELPW